MFAFFHLSSVIEVPSIFEPKLSWIGTPAASCTGFLYGLVVRLLAGYIGFFKPNSSI